MATPTYTAIASITLGSSASSVTFSSIPQDYRDLVLVVSGQISANSSIDVDINGDGTNANYSGVFAYGNGSSASSGTYSENVVGYLSSSVQASFIAQFMDYSATDKHKTILSRSSTTSDFAIMTALRWTNTSAITSLEIYRSAATLATGTTLALYGIAS